jgi:glycosyltransferase involved in cell wall biosynthesis
MKGVIKLKPGSHERAEGRLDAGSMVVKPEVLILTSESPERGGGAEHLVREMRRGLESHGYSVKVFHRRNSEPKWIATWTGRFGQKIANALNGFWIGRNAQKHLNENVVMVISHSDVGYYPLRSKEPLKLFHFHHGTFRAQSDAIRPFISRGGYLYLKWWNSMVLERFSGSGKTVFTCSDQVREEVAEFFGHAATVVWNPLDVERFKPLNVADARSTLGLPEEKPIGLFVGSTQPTKGFPMVRKLIDALPEVYWVLALRGGLPTNLSSLPNLRVLDNFSHDQLPSLYNAASFSLCPSLYEGFGYVVVESLACGTPVIASPGGASSLFLKDAPFSQFLIADPNDFPGFERAAREVLANSELYRGAVIERIRPRIAESMSQENWWRRFSQAANL